MKLKKILALVLAFAMIISVVSAFSVVSAATPEAKLGYMVYDKDGKNLVEGNLEAGTIYQVSVMLTDITSKKFVGAQVSTMFDKDVVVPVKADGTAATKYQDALIETADMYDADEGTGTFQRTSVGCEYNAEKAIYKYTLAIPAGSEYTNIGVDNDGTFEIVRFRIKALKNGKTGIKMVPDTIFKEDAKYETKIFLIKDKVEFETSDPAIRVGNMTYDSAFPAELIPKTFNLGTSAEDVIDTLLKKMIVTYKNDAEGESADIESDVTWAAPANYDANKAGTYEFVGTVETPDSYTGAAVTAKISVTLKKLAVNKDSEITVYAKDGVKASLPAKVAVSLENDTTVDLAVTWNEFTETTGTVTVEGTLTGTDNVEVGEHKAKATVVYAAENTDASFKEINDVEAEVAVDSENIADAAKAALPATIYGKNEADAPVYKDVTWNIKGEAPEGGYKVGSVIEFAPVAEGFDFKDFTAKVTVVVPEGKTGVTFDKTEVTVSYKNDAGATAASVTSAVALKATYDDTTVVDVKGDKIAWTENDLEKFDGTKVGTYVINGVWSDIYDHSVNVKLTVTITASGASSIEIKTSTTSVASLTKLTMNTGSSKTLYAVLNPEGAVDTITWASSNKSYATVTPSADGKSAVIKTKSLSGKVNITATTGSGATATLVLTINSTSNGGYVANGPYKNNNTTNSLLPSTADDIAAEEVIKSSPFIDLDGYNWAATQIETIRLLGIVSGRTATTFAPADNVTRAEFLAMLVRLFNLKAGANVKEFTDVSPDEWFYEAVKIASSLGIAYGYENGAFDPNAVITREDMAVFARRALEAAGITPTEALTSVFEDALDISDYAYDAVDYMTGIGVINGMGDGTFMPRATANRAQAAVVIYNLYIKMK